MRSLSTHDPTETRRFHHEAVFYAGEDEFAAVTVPFLQESLDAGEAALVAVDEGRIEDALVGRARPKLDAPSGRGLWVANQLCDLVQLRSGADGTTVRLHLHAPRR